MKRKHRPTAKPTRKKPITAAPKPSLKAGPAARAGAVPGRKKSPVPPPARKPAAKATPTGPGTAFKTPPAKPKTASAARPVPAGTLAPARRGTATPADSGRPKTAARKRARPAPPASPKVSLKTSAPKPARGSGPGQRFALGPAPVNLQPELGEEGRDLPEAYGSKRLFLTARDPHWLYAHWDFTAEQLRQCNADSDDRHLVLRVYANDFQQPPFREVHLHPESRNWFVHVGRGSLKCLAALGYYRKGDRAWTEVSRSAATLTPPDTFAPGAAPDFATIPVEVPFETLLALIRSAAKENIPLAEALLQLQAVGYPGLPEPADWPGTPWTPERERALAEVVGQCVSLDAVRRVWVGSMEITEMIRQRLAAQRGSAELAVPPSAGIPWSGALPTAPASVTSPFGAAAAPPRAFWFNVNAELIIYGATEPDATVTIGGHPIRLRPDGTFSFRFALPDGVYDLPAIARSADGVDERSARLEFRRSTAYQGEVGAHPQDPQLKPPSTEALD